MTTRTTSTVVALAALGLFAPSIVHAQDRLVGIRAAGAGVSYDDLRFEGRGLFQAPLPGQDSLRVRRAAQLTVPLTAGVPIGRAWMLDVTSIVAVGGVEVEDATTRTRRTAHLSGISDVRVRVTGRPFGDRLVVTAGLNAPTGKTSLDSAQLLTTRVLASPGLGFGAPAIGAGPSGTLGLLAAHQLGGWGTAVGASYEHRGSYAPVSALVAGVESIDFTPGDVLRVSVGADRVVGGGRVSASLASDFYRRDRLRGDIVAAGPAGTTTPAANDATLATVRLGPVISADLLVDLPAPSLRELVTWGAVRWRSRYERDGVPIPGSSGTYADAGMRATAPLTSHLDLFGIGEGRYYTGLAVGGGLNTAGTTAGTLTLGLSRQLGHVTIQPFVRGQGGRVRGQGPEAGQDRSFGGGGGGLTILTRF